jgi:hypothetical protein
MLPLSRKSGRKFGIKAAGRMIQWFGITVPADNLGARDTPEIPVRAWGLLRFRGSMGTLSPEKSADRRPPEVACVYFGRTVWVALVDCINPQYSDLHHKAVFAVFEISNRSILVVRFDLSMMRSCHAM